MKIIKAPEPINWYLWEKAVFLAGSIEMGAAINWQSKVIDELRNSKDVVILNPRRDDWDSSWTQKIDNVQFRQQVDWEIHAMTCCDIIALYFDSATKSPISLLELGLFATSGKLIVCCPEPFWRKGNVDIVCRKYGIINCVSFEDFIIEIKHNLEYKIKKHK